MKKRFMVLDATERATLEAGHQRHPQHQFRARCQALLWSADGHAVPTLAELLGVQGATVRAWFTRWETGGLANAPGPPCWGPTTWTGSRRLSRPTASSSKT